MDARNLILLSKIIVVVIAMVLLACIATLARVIIDPDPGLFPWCVGVLGLGVALICVALFTADAMRTIDLRPVVRRLIAGTLISGLLAAVAGGAAGVFNNAPSTQSEPRLNIRQLTLVETRGEADQLDFDVRKDPRYVGHHSPIEFLAVVAGYALEASGAARIELTISLENRNTGLAEITHRIIEKDPDDWKHSNPPTIVKSVTAIVGDDADCLPYLGRLEDRLDIGTGKVFLRLTATDLITGYSDTHEAQVDLAAPVDGLNQ